MRSKRATGTGAAVAVAHPRRSAATEAGRGCARKGKDGEWMPSFLGSGLLL